MKLWQAHNSETLMGLHCRALTDARFDGATVNVELARTLFSRVHANTAHVIERRPELITRQPEDAVVLFFVLAGEAFYYSSDGVRILRRGQFVVCDCDRPFMRGFSRHFQELSLKIHRHALFDQTGLMRIQAPRFAEFGGHQNPLANRLVDLIDAATHTDGPRLPDEDTLVRLVERLLGDDDGVDAPRHLAAARRYVEDHLNDPSLSAQKVASAVGISPRHLSRVFASVGTSVPQHVLDRRLTTATAMLRRPEAASMTIAEIAKRCGFTSITHFSRSFSQRFGERASDVRRRATQQRALASSTVSVHRRDMFVDSAIAAESRHNGAIADRS
ncbi:Transcriptional activator NphR [Mycolicibacterium chlorophenolicum]|uniref:Transcriptional activator NphR n=2 Tax=Mycolicibacterium chlorophenolicum TaxID=37916 RepID=A0A0J6WKD1_9MYCO|nr:Transcriptional activator NphR [Mycolicibacterium chlorophenolicum]